MHINDIIEQAQYQVDSEVNYTTLLFEQITFRNTDNTNR